MKHRRLSIAFSLILVLAGILWITARPALAAAGEFGTTQEAAVSICSLEADPDDVPAVKASGDVQEVTSGAMIGFNQLYALLDNDGASKYYGFQVTKPGLVVAIVTQVSSSGNSLPPNKVAVCSSAKSRLSAFSSPKSVAASGGGTNYYQAYALTPGTYYIEMQGYSGYVQGIQLGFTAWDASSAASKSSARTLNAKTTSRDLIPVNTASNEKWYTFTLSSDQHNELTIENNGEYSLDVKLYGPQNFSTAVPKEKSVSLYYHDAYNNKLKWPKGTYYVCVSRNKREDSGVFTITRKASMSVMTVSAIADQTYTGGQIKPSVSVKYVSETLRPNTDYTVSYLNNTNVGQATIRLTGKGFYTGTYDVNFNIIPKKPTGVKATAGKKKFTVKWKKVAGATGYQIRASLKSSMKSAKKATVKKGSAKKGTIKSLKAKKRYYIQVRTYQTVSGKKYYSDWSKKISKKTK